METYNSISECIKNHCTSQKKIFLNEAKKYSIASVALRAGNARIRYKGFKFNTDGRLGMRPDRKSVV